MTRALLFLAVLSLAAGPLQALPAFRETQPNTGGSKTKAATPSLRVTGAVDQAGAGLNAASAAYRLVGGFTRSHRRSGDCVIDDRVDVRDLSYLLNVWNSSDPVADLFTDGKVEVRDLSFLLHHWSQ